MDSFTLTPLQLTYCVVALLLAYGLRGSIGSVMSDELWVTSVENRVDPQPTTHAVSR